MDVVAKSGSILTGSMLAYVTTDGEYYVKYLAASNLSKVAGTEPKLPNLLQYNMYDFDHFFEESTSNNYIQYGGELFTTDTFTVMKVAIPATITQVSVLSGEDATIRFSIYPNDREKQFNNVVTLYQANDNININPDQLGKESPKLIHESNICNPHESQVVTSTIENKLGGLLGEGYVNYLTNRYNGAILGTTMLTEDSCKYWLGNFDGDQN